MLCYHDCIVKHLLIAAVLACGSAAFVMAQLAASLSRRIVFFLLCWAIISIFFHFIQFLETVVSGEVDRMLIFISFFHLFTDSAKYPAGRAYLPAQLVSSFPPPLLPWRPSRGDWNYRKTKTKNVLSCFISFTNE